LANNGQTVYTIVVNLGSLELQAVAREINNLTIDNYAYAPDVEAISPFNNSDGDDEGVTNGDDKGEAKQASVGDSEEEAKQASVCDKEGEAKQASVTQSLKFSNKDCIDNVDVDSDKEFCLSFPRDCNSRNFILGGPQRLDTMGMTPAKEEAAMKKYRKERTSFTDKSRLSLMMSMASKGVAALPQKNQSGYFLGDQKEMVQPMVDVESHHLSQIHTFQLKERLQLCIAEEVNLHQLKVKTIRNNHNNIIIAGLNFYVYATYSVQSGRMVRHACCREGDNISVIPPNHR
jgi:hypothetical protein